MAMQLVRSSTGNVLSDKIELFDGWHPDYPAPVIKTVNNVSYFQKRGRLEWVAFVTFAFCDLYPASNLERMENLVKASFGCEWFSLTDRSGAVHSVRTRNVPEPVRAESRSVEYYYLECEMVRRGFL